MLEQHESFAKLLLLAKAAFESNQAAMTFSAFPIDLSPQTVVPFRIPPADLMQSETGLFTQVYGELRDAIIVAGALAHWRETYKNTGIGQDFMDRFGCYPIIGPCGPYQSSALWLWMVYMPPHLHYPWHHHPAEEFYLVLAGEAEFHRAGMTSETLREGDGMFHASNQPHAMTTTDHPVLCLVAWRNGFDVEPALSDL